MKKKSKRSTPADVISLLFANPMISALAGLGSFYMTTSVLLSLFLAAYVGFALNYVYIEAYLKERK